MALPKPAPSPGPHPARPSSAERPVGTARPPGIDRPVGTARPAGAEKPVGTGRPPATDTTTVALPRIPAGHAMQFQPMVHVEDMPAAVAFYQRLGAEVVHGSGTDDWVLLQLGTTQLGLLAHPPRAEDGECTVELNFAAATPLDDLERRLRDVGVTIAAFETHPDFGDQLQLRSPDGLLIKINQLEPEIEK
jgi:catechol 2,3-dioxygenase-like lactoylglutathione lyase family enzyme